MAYAVRMLFFGLALLIAAQPDLDNPGCYRNGSSLSVRLLCGVPPLHGDGYCVDPTRLSNVSNPILDINQACITASSVQWIIASLAYMVNAVLVLEYLALNK